MTVLGIDYDTRAVHCVLLDDDTNAARYIPVPFVDHRPPFRFDDARNIREALREAMRFEAVAPGKHPRSADGWESITLVGVEKPYCQAKDSAWKYGLVVGQILSCIPRSIPVLELPPNDRLFGWKALSVGRTNATKDDVKRWARLEVIASEQDGNLERPSCDRPQWPQDAFDAYCIARAVCRLNEQAVDAA